MFGKKELIPDAVGLMRSGLSVNDPIFIKAVPEEDRRKNIKLVANYVREYLDIQAMKEMGFTFNVSDYPFSRIWIYGWIRSELMNGRESGNTNKGNRRPVK